MLLMNAVKMTFIPRDLNISKSIQCLHCQTSQNGPRDHGGGATSRVVARFPLTREYEEYIEFNNHQ